MSDNGEAAARRMGRLTALEKALAAIELQIADKAAEMKALKEAREGCIGSMRDVIRESAPLFEGKGEGSTNQ